MFPLCGRNRVNLAGPGQQMLQQIHRRLGVTRHLAMGQRQQLDPPPAQDGQLAVVALERLAATVELIPLELDHEPRFRPVGVDDVAADGCARDGVGQSVSAHEVEEEPLELGLGGGPKRGTLSEQRQQFAEPVATRVALDDRAKLAVVEGAETLGTLEDALEVAAVEQVGEVDNGAFRRGDWNPVDDRSVVRMKGRGAVDRDAFP